MKRSMFVVLLVAMAAVAGHAQDQPKAIDFIKLEGRRLSDYCSTPVTNRSMVLENTHTESYIRVFFQITRDYIAIRGAELPQSDAKLLMPGEEVLIGCSKENHTGRNLDYEIIGAAFAEPC